MSSTIPVILAVIPGPSIPPPPLTLGSYSLGIAIILFCGCFLACFVHFRFLKSNRVSAARLKAKRHRQGCVAGINYDLRYPSGLEARHRRPFVL